MAKRRTGVGKGKRSTSYKTAKRLAIKKTMLEEKKKSIKHQNQRRKKANNQK